MKYRRLGKSGLQVSEVSLGSWVTFASQVDDAVAEACMRTAYEAGVNFFDNAEGYAGGKSEVVMGTALRTLGWPRDTFVVSSKVFWGGGRPNQTGLSRKHVFEACHAALRRLQVDYLDLYFCHRPDPNTPIEETVAALHQLVQAGKVLYWGTSEWAADQIMEACAVARREHLTPPTMEQPQYSILYRRRVEQEYARLYDPATVGLGTTVWSPLAGGILTGKYAAGIPADSRAAQKGMEWWSGNFDKDSVRRKIGTVEKLRPLAADLGATLAQFGIAWTLKNPRVSTTILGASRVEQLHETLRAGEIADKITPEVMAKVDEIFTGVDDR